MCFKRDITHLDAIHDLFNNLDGCFHLAAIPQVALEFDQWLPTHTINLLGSLNVFKSAIDAGNIPVVYASSCAVYSNSTQFPLTEDQCLYPLSAYGCDKLSTELNARFLSHAHQLPTIGFRIFNAYGPYQPVNSPYSGVITRFITNLIAGDPLILFGHGEQTRDFVFVEDIIHNMIQAMNQLPFHSGVMNLCTGIPTSINQLATTIAAILEKECVKHYQPARFGDAQASLGDPQKMKQHGFKINHALQQGLAKTIEYYLQLRPLPIQRANIPHQLLNR